MRAERLGSYSTDAILPGTSNLSRLIATLYPLEQLYLVARRQGHHGLLPVRPVLDAVAPHAVGLTFHVHHIDADHLHLKPLLHRFLDLYLVGRTQHGEGVLVLPAQAGGFLRDHGTHHYRQGMRSFRHGYFSP